jgi:peptide-methionine (S)-S-oxide reductase
MRIFEFERQMVSAMDDKTEDAQGKDTKAKGSVEKGTAAAKELQVATFGGGCFWCTEAVFLKLKGVEKVVSGYAGGKVKDPTYEQVCTGLTGHAEVIRIEYKPEEIRFEQLLDVFFHTHDPTTKNRQGADVGTQYRSAVFFNNDEEKEITKRVIAELDKSGDFDDPIVTTLEEMKIFYPAEDYHQNYFAQNPGNSYCRAVVGPKVAKFLKRYKDMAKKDE